MSDPLVTRTLHRIGSQLEKHTEDGVFEDGERAQVRAGLAGEKPALIDAVLSEGEKRAERAVKRYRDQVSFGPLQSLAQPDPGKVAEFNRRYARDKAAEIASTNTTVNLFVAKFGVDEEMIAMELRDLFSKDPEKFDGVVEELFGPVDLSARYMIPRIGQYDRDDIVIELAKQLTSDEFASMRPETAQILFNCLYGKQESKLEVSLGTPFDDTESAATHTILAAGKR